MSGFKLTHEGREVGELHNWITAELEAGLKGGERVYKKEFRIENGTMPLSEEVRERDTIAEWTDRVMRRLFTERTSPDGAKEWGSNLETGCIIRQTLKAPLKGMLGGRQKTMREINPAANAFDYADPHHAPVQWTITEGMTLDGSWVDPSRQRYEGTEELKHRFAKVSRNSGRRDTVRDWVRRVEDQEEREIRYVDREGERLSLDDPMEWTTIPNK
jgi:hypothetical protein